MKSFPGENMGQYCIQEHTNQIIAPDHEKNRYNTPFRSELVEATTNHYQQNPIEQKNQPKRDGDTHKIQETI